MEKIRFDNNLKLSRCPHCSVDNPNLPQIHQFETNNSEKKNPRRWKIYQCQRCGGVITASAFGSDFKLIGELFPSPEIVNEDIPNRARQYLIQAIESIHAPAGSIMLSASSVDSMLKEKGFKEGSLYSRIDSAVEDNIITKEMSDWAHKVRLDANDQRHTDENSDLPDESEAKLCIEFVKALGLFMFGLPAMIKRGLKGKEEVEE